jgi:tetratricopeptide (TPR) repeat protein
MTSTDPARASFVVRTAFSAVASVITLLGPSPASAQSEEILQQPCSPAGRLFTPSDAIKSCEANNRGLAHYQKSEYDLAIADFSEAIRLKPTDTVAYGNRAGAYLKKGNYDQAITDFSQAIRLDPRDWVSYSNRGYAHELQGKPDLAIEDYKAALAIDPSLKNETEALDRLSKAPKQPKPPVPSFAPKPPPAQGILSPTERKKFYDELSKPTPTEPNLTPKATPTNPSVLTPEEGKNGEEFHFILPDSKKLPFFQPSESLLPSSEKLKEMLPPLPPNSGFLRTPYENPGPK